MNDEETMVPEPEKALTLDLGTDADFDPSLLGIVARAIYVYGQIKAQCPPSHARHAAMLFSRVEELHALTIAWMYGADGSEPMLKLNGDTAGTVRQQEDGA